MGVRQNRKITESWGGASRTLGLLALLIAAPVSSIVAQGLQSTSNATLQETLVWIRSKIAGERIDAVGLRIQTDFGADSCQVYFKKYGGALPLASGKFLLSDIGSVDVKDQPVGATWTGTFLVFHTADGSNHITRGDQTLRQANLAERSSSTFEWHLGSVARGGSTKDLRELGDRLRNAFVHAIGLCGGRIAKEPF
jgi:hypothetical protein